MRAEARRLNALIVEDDLRLHQVIPQLLEPQQIGVTFAATGAQALALLRHMQFDVALVDLGLPDVDGIELIRSIARNDPPLPILVLTAAQTEERILSSLRAGAAGFLFKEDLATRLRSAVEELLAGGVPLSAAAGRLLLSELRSGRTGDGGAGEVDASGLTERERTVLDWLGEGYSYTEVADRLQISINTVRTHVRNVYEKLGVSTKTQAVREALRRGLLTRTR